MTRVRLHRMIPALLLILTAGCGGSSGGGRVAEGGIGGTGISTGAVTATGSIVVNGRRFALDSAAITVNGNPADAAALRIGRIVTVAGDLDDGIAERVSFVPRLVGPVDVIAGSTTGTLDCGSDAATFTAMQQTVRIEASTIVECSDASAIGQGEPVLVSGYRRTDDVLVASYVQRLVGSTFPVNQVIGRVTEVTRTRFSIGALEVSADDEPDVGDRVRVRGSYNPDTKVLTATRVSDDAPVSGEPGEAAEVEGIVDAFTDADAFRVNGIPVDSSDARIEDPLGNDADDRLGPNIEVEVDGRFDTAGVLVADRVEVEIEENVEIFADASSVDASAGIVSFFGDALKIEVGDRTRLKDDTDAVEDFGLDDIAVTDRLELEGFTVGDAVAATRIDREDTDSRVTIEAPVQAIDETDGAETVAVLGLQPIDVSKAVDSGDPIADIKVGDIVEIRWENGREPLQDPADSIEKDLD